MTAPPTITNALVRDWDFGAIPNPVANASISTVPDNTGTINMGQATASRQPTLQQATVNGKTFWCGSFDGVDDNLQAAPSVADSHDGVTVVIIGTKTASQPTNPRVVSNQKDTSSKDWQAGGFAVSYTDESSTWGGIRTSSANDNPVDQAFSIASPLAYSTWAVSVTAFDGSGGSGGYCYLDGTSLGAIVESAIAGQFTLGNTALGAYLDPTPLNWTPCDVARVLIYSGILTAADRATIDSWVQDTYGITVSDYQSSGTEVDASAADTLGLSDAATTALAASRTPADDLGLSDATTVALDATRAQADTLALTDTATTTLDAARDLADDMGLSDAVSVVMSRVVTVADVLEMIDEASGQSRSSTARRVIAGPPMTRVDAGAPRTRVTAGAPTTRVTAALARPPAN